MKVSVIVPMYNAEASIKKCLLSVLNQTYRGAIEIIIVNDGSVDRSEDIVNQFIAENESSKCSIKLINQVNGGVSKARNMGLVQASGDYIALLDSDDEWLLNKLEVQLAYLQKDLSIDFLGCLRNNEDLGFPYNLKEGAYRITLRKLLFKTVAQTSTVVFKKDILSDIGFYDENQKFAEDANYWLKISLSKKMIVLPKSLVITGGGKPHYGAAGLSSNLLEMEKGVQKNMLEIYDLKKINFVEYLFFKNFSKLKYYRRLFIVKFRN